MLMFQVKKFEELLLCCLDKMKETKLILFVE